MVKPEVIRKRLDKLEEYLTFLESSQRYSRAEFINDPERYGSAERFLQLAIESLIDMGHHVVAETGAGPVDQYRDIPVIFAEQGWIDDALEEKWVRMIGFRNVLVHEYEDIDRGLVFNALQDDLEDLRRLCSVFARFL